jgi:hypothetical protein
MSGCRKSLVALAAGVLVMLTAGKAWSGDNPPGQASGDGQSGSSASPLAAPELNKQNVERMIVEALVILNKSKDTFRVASAKLPDLIKDNREFRRLDREVELCRDEIYPAVASGEKLKDNPHLLRDAVRMYIAMRILEQRSLRLSDHLSTIEGGSPLSMQVFDMANKVGRINLRLQPYFLRLVDAYQAQTPEGSVEDYMHWQGQQTGPVL